MCQTECEFSPQQGYATIQISPKTVIFHLNGKKKSSASKTWNSCTCLTLSQQKPTTRLPGNNSNTAAILPPQHSRQIGVDDHHLQCRRPYIQESSQQLFTVPPSDFCPSGSLSVRRVQCSAIHRSLSAFRRTFRLTPLRCLVLFSSLLPCRAP